jgi:hypothetical protein
MGDNMIKMVFGGGLGNQLFQYAFLLSQTIKHENTKPEILAIMHRNNLEDRREFSLTCINPTLNLLIEDEENLGIKYKLYVMGRKCLRGIGVVFGIKGRNLIRLMSKFHIVYSYDIYHFYDDLQINTDCIVEGGFQSWKYFENYKDMIRQEFMIKTEPSIQNQNMLRQIESCNAVCVHVRRGDYTNNNKYSKMLNVCNYEYYQEGMCYIESKVNNPVFFIFSNCHEDIEWIKKNYNFNKNVVYVDLNNPDYEELRLMYSCRHFIIANSTFSWWAQYLCPHQDKLVVAPSKWSNTNIDASDIYMDEWKLIKTGSDKE